MIAWIVPGSQLVANQIVDEGLNVVFENAGFEIRQPGCSACLAMNDDKIPSGEYCVATSNRNFEGRQGQGYNRPLFHYQQKILILIKLFQQDF